MNLHEYQAKELLASRGVPIPRGSISYTPLEALIAARQLRTDKIVLKAQIHSGGRGKAGGVAVLSMNDDIRSRAAEILGKRLVTNQTGPHGKTVSALLVEEVIPVEAEIYLGVVLNRSNGQVTIMASPEGRNGDRKTCQGVPGQDLYHKSEPAQRTCIRTRPEIWHID